MKTSKKEKREIEIEVEIFTYCDKCNLKIERDSMYDVFECTVSHTIGRRYPECNDYKEREVNLCQSCAIRLFNLLIENGYRINIIDHQE